MKYMINVTVRKGYMEYRTSYYETVALASTKKEAIKKAKAYAANHVNADVCIICTKTMEEIEF